MRRPARTLLLAAALILAAFAVLALSPRPHTAETFAMGSFVTQTVYGPKGEEAAALAAAAVQETENLLSWRVEGSDVAALNRAAGGAPVAIEPQTAAVLETALAVSRESGGAFDVTVAPLSRLWDFDGDPHLPKSEDILAALPLVDHTKLILSPEGAALQTPQAAVDLGAVGKGAAAEAAVSAYREAGVKRGIVSVGGSVGVYGKKPFGRPWRVAVRDPGGTGALGTLSLEEGFVSTSGSYEKNFTENGVTYHHLLDPKTGYPAESGLKSVTVVCSGGALSDALATACFVLGVEESRALLETFEAEAVFVTSEEPPRVLVTPGLSGRFALSDPKGALEVLP